MAEISVPTEREHEGQLRRKSYRAILELSSRHPLLSPKDIALMIGASEPWVKKVMSSDAFRAQRAILVEKLFGPQLEVLRSKMMTTADMLVQAVAEKIAHPDAEANGEVILKALTTILDRIMPVKQVIAPPPPPAPSNTTINIATGVTPEDMARARARILSHGASIPLEAQNQIPELNYVDEDGLPTQRRIRSNEDGT